MPTDEQRVETDGDTFRDLEAEIRNMIPEVMLQDEDNLDKGTDELSPVPEYGEKAAQHVIELAEKRAAYIESFCRAQVERAESFQQVGCKLAVDIRKVAASEADSIRRETARMEKAGQAVVVAYDEFHAGTQQTNGSAKS